MLTTEEMKTTSAVELSATGPYRTWSGGRRCLIVGGVLFAAANLLHPLQHSESAYRYPTWELAHLVMLASLPFLLLGLPYLHHLLARTGHLRDANAAAVLTLLGLLGIAPSSAVEAFVAPEAGHAFMEQLQRGGYGGLIGAFGTAFLLGTVVLGVLVQRVRLGVPGLGPVLIASAVSLVVPVVLNMTESRAAGVIVIASTSIYGLAVASLGLSRYSKTAQR